MKFSRNAKCRIERQTEMCGRKKMQQPQVKNAAKTA